jgi:hypothetical protein
MSKANSPVLRGLSPEAIAFNTITTHDWSDSSEWPVQDPLDSKYVIQPEDGKAMVLTGVLVKFSENMAMIDGNAMIIEGVIVDNVPGCTIELTRFKKVRDYVKRADAQERLDFSLNGGEFSKPVMILKLDFSEHVFLWSSAGLTAQGPKKDKLGIPKFRKLVARMENNLPLRSGSDEQLEIATSRYFAAVYVDPDYVAPP